MGAGNGQLVTVDGYRAPIASSVAITSSTGMSIPATCEGRSPEMRMTRSSMGASTAVIPCTSRREIHKQLTGRADATGASARSIPRSNRRLASLVSRWRRPSSPRPPRRSRPPRVRCSQCRRQSLSWPHPSFLPDQWVHDRHGSSGRRRQRALDMVDRLQRLPRLRPTGTHRSLQRVQIKSVERLPVQASRSW